MAPDPATSARIAEQYREWRAECLAVQSASSEATAGYWADAAFEAELEASLLEGVQPVETLESITA